MIRQNGYSALQIALHWIVAALIFGAFFTHESMGQAFRAQLAGTYEGWPLHVWLGLAALTFIVIRILVRRAQGAPAPVPGNPALADKAAVWGHRLLYLLMILAPLGGALAWFGGLRDVGDVHEIVGKALVILAAGHALVAIAHAVFRKDGTFSRMIRPAP